MKHQSPESIQASATPVNDLTLKARRGRLIHILRTEYANQVFSMGNRLEFMLPEYRDEFRVPGSIFHFAAKDPVLSTAGLTGETYGEFRKFFEMADNQTHAVSCDCLGAATGAEIAGRLEHYGVN